MTALQRISALFLLASGWQRFLLAFCAGAVSALALPPLNLFPVMFATMPALVWLIDGAHGDQASGTGGRAVAHFLPGWWFGFGYLLAGLWWIGSALLIDAGSFAWALPLAVLALPALLAVFYGLATLAAGLLWQDGWRRVLILAGALSAGEFLRGTVLTGFPWNALGYAAMPSPLAMQTAGLVGLYGVTLLAVIGFAGPLVAIAMPASRGAGGRSLLALSLAICALHTGYGAARLAANPAGSDDGATVVRIMQPSIPQTLKSDPAAEGRTVESYFELSTARSPEGREGLSGIDYLVWPESAFPFLLTERRDVLARIGAMLPEGTRLLTGATRAEPGISGNPYGHVYNSVYLIDSSGEIAAAADKVHLVPFGEYLPFQESLEALGLQQLTKQRGGFDAGSERTVIRAAGGPAILPLICYEIIFPGRILGAGMPAENRPDWLLNVTNDAWFGRTPGPYQHLQQAQVRAVEEGLPLVRAANSGISAVTDGFGRIVAKIGLEEKGVVDAAIPAPAPDTVFSRWGHAAFAALLIFAVLAGLPFGAGGRGGNRP